jgi:hypothetical protein
LSLLRCRKLDYNPSEPQKSVQKIHPEKEEKPVVQPIKKSSEETHGGDESTVSIPFSPSVAKAGELREETGQSQTQSQGGPEATDGPDGEEHEEIAGVSENNEDVEASRSGEGFEDEEDAGGNGDEIEEFEEDEGAEASEDEASEDNVDGSGDDEEDEGEDNGDQGGIGEYNTDQAVDLSHPRASIYLATEFYRLLELLMEEKTKVFDNRGAEEFNMKKLILRPYEKKPLSHYMQARVKEAIVILLDNSGSMDWWAENLQVLASIALERGDVEIYTTPNGSVQTRLTNRGYEPVDHTEVMRKLRGRRVIYVGDFDGANTPIELSWSNDVVWVCPEVRYKRFRAHDWVKYGEGDFRGVFIRAWTLEEALSALKKVDRFYNLWIDLHEDHTFDDVTSE